MTNPDTGPTWFLIEINPADKTDHSTDSHLEFETLAGDRGGADWLAITALKDFALSKNISPDKLASSTTPCPDC